MPTVCESEFQYGFEKFQWKAHDSSGSPYHGEIEFTALLSGGNDVGAISTPPQLVNSPTGQQKKAQQRTYPINYNVQTAEATFTVRLNMEDIENMALAMGATSSDSQTIGGDTFKIAGPTDNPDFISIIGTLPNQQDSSLPSYFYAPRVKVSTNLTEILGREEDREADVEFILMASCQDGTSSSVDMRMFDEAGAVKEDYMPWIIAEKQ